MHAMSRHHPALAHKQDPHFLELFLLILGEAFACHSIELNISYFFGPEHSTHFPQRKKLVHFTFIGPFDLGDTSIDNSQGDFLKVILNLLHVTELGPRIPSTHSAKYVIRRNGFSHLV